MLTVGVIGAGYVGLVTAVCYASKGFHVFLYEKDLNKSKSLALGKIPFYEKDLQAMFLNVLNKQLFLVESLDQIFSQKVYVDIIFSCVPTPSQENGTCNLSYVFEVCSSLKQTLNKDIIFINKSTIPPKTCDFIISNFFKDLDKHQVELVHNPEFLRQGQAVEDFLHPDRIIFGLNPSSRSKEILKSIANKFISEDKIIFTDFVTAELIKYGANVMLACRISMINQIFRIAKAVGANMNDTKTGIGLDHRIGQHYLSEGPGFGGSCLPKDLQALTSCAKNLSVDTTMLEAIFNFNNTQLNWFFNEWKKEVGLDLNQCNILVDGIAFKPGTSDLRNSVKLELLKKIAAERPNSIDIFDTSLSENDIEKIYSEINFDKKNTAKHDKKTDALKSIKI